MTRLNLTVEEAQAILLCGRVTIFKLIASGKLKKAPSYGRQTLITAESIESAQSAKPSKVKPPRARPVRGDSSAGILALIGR